MKLRTQPSRVVAWIVLGTWWLMGLGSAVQNTSIDPWHANIWQWTLDFGIGIAAILLLRYRHRWPLQVALILAAALCLSIATLPLSFWSLASLAKRRRLKEVIPVILIQLLASLAVPVFLTLTSSAATLPTTLAGIDQPATFSSLSALAITTVFAQVTVVVIGFYAGARAALLESLRARAASLEAQQELRARQAELDERQRIAREMHDVLAHRISLVALHAGVLKMRTDLDEHETKRIATIISENAHASLTELRAMLSQLRTNEDTKPQPTLADLTALIAQTRSLGTTVTLDCEIDLTTLPQTVGRHAYRIMQEALTNARKHAPSAAVAVKLNGGPSRGLQLLVRNRVTCPGTLPGAGVGLVGIAERVALCGGTAKHGISDGIFELEVEMPW